ncbi:MAG: hypothetical protein LBL66_04465 [Clostridiales bacterium]|jgi:hypothetical protein|nr:hypothetical protein [Clostridiales bacterium]
MISSWVDFILSRTVIFVLAFIWIRFYADGIWVAVFAALAVTVLCSMVLSFLSRRKKRKKDLTGKDLKHAETVMTQLMFMENARVLAFFAEFLKKHYRCMATGECVLAETGAEATLIFTSFRHEPLSPDGLARIYIAAGKYSADKILIFTNGFAPAAADAARRFAKPRVILQNAADTYKFLKTYETFPDVTVKLNPPKNRKKFKVLLAVALAHRNAKGYLFGALFMVFGSFFIRYNLYYLISASAFMTLALLCRVNFKFKSELTEEKVI